MDALAAPLAAIDDGVIAARNGRILAVEPFRDYRRRAAALPGADIRDLGDVLLAPGFVNCHTHLELSHLAGGIAPGLGFPAWVRSLIALDGKETAEEAALALDAAAAHLALHGTAAALDITSRRPERILAALDAKGVTARPCLEIIGHRPETPEALTRLAVRNPAFSLAAHALYSTAASSFVAAKAWCGAHRRPFSMHLAEHAEEVECLAAGSGAFYNQLRARLVPAGWRAPMRRPVRYAADLGLLSPGTIAVHCVTCLPDEIDLLARSGAAVCLCPRSNTFIGVGEAPVRALADAGSLLTLGTDSLASNHDLTLWHESEYFLQKNLMPPNALLRMATVNGASAAMLSEDVGSLDTGKRFCYSVFPKDTVGLFHLA
jgi:cytosine/adenosine deaminase-related metal-dependent hydrolase